MGKRKHKKKAGIPSNDDKKNKIRKFDHVDEMFAILKSKKEEKAAQVARIKDDEKLEVEKAIEDDRRQKSEREKMLGNSNSGEVRPVRYDTEGLPIYTEEALNINEGGETADCPFDCWCCY